MAGVVAHVVANHGTAPLDFRYAERWDGMTALARWWVAASGRAGGSPPLAPLVLAQSALCLLLAVALDVAPGPATGAPGDASGTAAAASRSRAPSSGAATEPPAAVGPPVAVGPPRRDLVA